MALLSLRTTPLNNHLLSPTEILYGRKIRTRIPTLLNTNNAKDNQIWDRMNINNKKQQQYYNRNAKDLPELTIGSKVLALQENDPWLPVTVIDKCTEPRSYIVEMQNDGKLLRRNRWHPREIYIPKSCQHIVYKIKGFKHHSPNRPTRVTQKKSILLWLQLNRSRLHKYRPDK